MQENKIIISCSQCGHQVRIPSDKHIRFNCAACNHPYEYNNGVQVIEAEVIDSPALVGDTSSNGSKDRFPYRIVVPGILALMIFLLVYASREEDSSKLSASNIAVPPTTSQPVAGPLTLDTLAYAGVSSTTNADDIQFDSILQQFLEDLLEDQLESLMENILEEAEHGDWKKADEWYEKTVRKTKEAGLKGRRLLTKYDAKLVELKTRIIAQNPDKGLLPGFAIVDPAGPEKEMASDHIYNDSRQTLTVYYSGPQNTAVTIPPRSTAIIHLKKGVYAVSVVAADPEVVPLKGMRSYRGYTHRSAYEIVLEYKNKPVLAIP